MEETKPKILLAEDEEPLRELYRMRFEVEDFDVIFAKDGEEALLRTRQEKPDVILLDIMMPKKSGMEVLKELKEDPSTSNIPVIMLTVLSNEKIKQEALELGAEYLVKVQVQPKEVVDFIKRKIEFMRKDKQ